MTSDVSVSVLLNRLVYVHGAICEQLIYEHIVLVIYIVDIHNVKWHKNKLFRRYMFLKYHLQATCLAIASISLYSAHNGYLQDRDLCGWYQREVSELLYACWSVQ